jgi:hypothetical protein
VRLESAPQQLRADVLKRSTRLPIGSSGGDEPPDVFKHQPSDIHLGRQPNEVSEQASSRIVKPALVTSATPRLTGWSANQQRQLALPKSSLREDVDTMEASNICAFDKGVSKGTSGRATALIRLQRLHSGLIDVRRVNRRPSCGFKAGVQSASA